MPDSNDLTSETILVDPAVGVPEVPPPVSGEVPASALFGDDSGETLQQVIERETKKVRENQPKAAFEVPAIPERGLDGKFLKKGQPSKAAPKPVEVKPATKPTEAKAAPKPAEVKPAAKPPEPKAAPKPAEAKIKVGGKEYTEKELEALLTQKSPAAAAPEKVESEAPKGPTQEQVAAAELKAVEDFAARISATVPESELESILVGGVDGAKALGTVLARVAGKAILETRKSIYDELNPLLSNFAQTLFPVQQQAVELEKHATEATFRSKYPEFSDEQDMVLARDVANALLQQYPDAVRAMNRDQFVEEVAKQADKIQTDQLRRWHPAFQGTWREWKQQQVVTTPPATTPPATTPPATTPPATTPPATTPPAAAPPKVRPPGSNSPAPTVFGNPQDSNWQAGVAKSLI